MEKRRRLLEGKRDVTQSLFVAWRTPDPSHGRWEPVGRLDGDAGGYRFQYTRGARRLEEFAPFPGMPDLEAVYESDELFPLFANRLLAPSRPEYEAFLAWGGFDPNNPPDPIAVLVRVQPAIARLIPLTANLMQPRQERSELVEVPQSADVAALDLVLLAPSHGRLPADLTDNHELSSPGANPVPNSIGPVPFNCPV